MKIVAAILLLNQCALFAYGVFLVSGGQLMVGAFLICVNLVFGIVNLKTILEN